MGKDNSEGTTASFLARVVPSSMDRDVLSLRSAKGRVRAFRGDLTRACAKVGLTRKTVDAAGVEVRITIERLED